jgi:hypothetical protein
MSVRFLIAIGAAVATAAAAGAQPDKDLQRAKASPAPASTPVVLASASDVRRPSTTAGQNSAEPMRRVAPRVTTCRCGDARSSQDQSAEEQPDQ